MMVLKFKTTEMQLLQINMRKMFLIPYVLSILNPPKRNAESVGTFGLHFFSPTR